MIYMSKVERKAHKRELLSARINNELSVTIDRLCCQL